MNQNKSNDIENEFYKRFLSLFASYYDTPSTDPINSFPPAPPNQNKDDSQNKPKSSLSQPLTSGIWDVRLKKAVEKYQNEIEESNNEINQKINERVELLESNERENNLELTDTYMPEKASRPEVPKYMQCIETDKKREEEQRNLSKSTKIDNTLAIRQFNIRRKKQEQRSREWKRRFQEKQREDERKHQEFLATLPKTERSSDFATTRQSIKDQKQFAKTLYERRIKEGNEITKTNFEQFKPNRQNPYYPNIDEEEEEEKAN